MRTSHIKKSVAMSSALFVALMGVTTSADALAPNPGKGNHEKTEKTDKGSSQSNSQGNHGTKGQGNHGTKGQGNGHSTQPQDDSGSHGSSGSHSGTHGNSGSTGNTGTQGNSGNSGNTGNTGTHGNAAKGGASSDPAGNNGTVKVDDDPWLGPNGHGGTNPGNGVGNDPHLGCNFQVEWYGFDEGADIISTVTFEMQAPTQDVVLGGYTPTQVFVGGDAAGGGTDLDGKQTYTLSFDGAPHPKHGYHVKLTINTPGSIGSDVKHKVFWVEGCESSTPETPGTPETPETPGTPDTPGTDTPGTDTPDTPEVPGTTGTDTPPEVAGEQAHAPHQQIEVKGEQAAANKAAQAAVPTVVNSGLVPVLSAAHTGQWPLALGGFGMLLLLAGLLTRRARS
jgi:hypothetical protein